MGDRANVAVQENGKRVYFYTHWDGVAMPSVVQAALQRGKSRWHDPSYLARIVFCEMVRHAHFDDTTGFGISAEPGDNSYPFIVVDCDKQEVRFEPDERKTFEYVNRGYAVPAAYSFTEYIALKNVDWSLVSEKL